MKKLSLFLIVILIISCNLFTPVGDIQFIDTILDGQFVVSLAFEDDGTAWAGIIRDQYGLVKINPDGSTEIFDHTNSCLVDSANIWEIKIDGQGKVWMLNADGLICFDGENFTRYDSIDNNNYIPRAFEKRLAIDNDDNIWFIGYNPWVNCPTQKIFSFDGDEFTSYEPNGLNLDQYTSIKDIEIDNNGNVWFSFYRGDPVFLKFDGSEWAAYDTSDIGFVPYNISDIEFDSDNNLWFNDDYTFSSIAYLPQHSLYVFDGENKAQGFGDNLLISEICIDDHDNVWFTGLSPRLGILDMNQKWVIDNSDDVGFCRVMEKAPNGDMWLGTSDGIMIYRYCQTK
jgi:ligand-binding sensor domain-containing protein